MNETEDLFTSDCEQSKHINLLVNTLRISNTASRTEVKTVLSF